MNEFDLIDKYFKSIPHDRSDVIFGIGDDAACLQIPAGMQLVVSCDTLVSDVHFLSHWDAYEIAYKAVMVNISDIAAMGAAPSWITLSLTLPDVNQSWLQRFSSGIQDALACFNTALVGGDTTRGPLSIALTIHGLIPQGKAVRRNGAQPGDKIFVSGDLGAAALALAFLNTNNIDITDRTVLMAKLHRPNPRVDLNSFLQNYASAAIDISDGLAADLNHICESSKVGACLVLDSIPAHPLVKKYQKDNAIKFTLRGGDDYELCFTAPQKNEDALLKSLAAASIACYPIGMIESELGLRGKKVNGDIVPISSQGYSHF